MGSTGSATTSSTYSPPQSVLQNYEYVTDLAKQAQQQPFVPYGGEMVAGLTPTQEAGITNVNQAVGTAAPYYQAGLAGTLGAYGGYTPQAYQQGVQGYMSPYLQNALGATAAQLQNVNQQQQQQLKGNAISQGAYGGDRAGIAMANLINQQNLAMGQTLGQMAQQGYSDAARNYLTGLGAQGGLAAQFGQLGTGAQTAALQGAQAQLAAGAQQQATQQAVDQALYNQFLQQQAYPFQTTQYLANIVEGIGAGSGGTSATTSPGPNLGSQIFGALGALSVLSDPRMKENMKPVGETYDGQKIYKFNYKGDPVTHMGLNAAETEKHKPEAVHKTIDGIRGVDYHVATEDAAEKGHFAQGGLASMGGAVSPSFDRENYEVGGSASLGDIPYLDFLKGLSRVPTVKKIGGKPLIPDAPKAFSDNSMDDVTKRIASIKGYGSKGGGLFAPGGIFGSGGLFGGSSGGSYGFATGFEPGAFARGGLAGERSAYQTDGYVSPNDPNSVFSADDLTSRISSALGAIESGQDYSAMGPVTKSGDRAHGFSQVMGSNIPSWTRQYFGKELTPEDYLNNPQAQVAVTRGKVRDLVNAGYSPQDVASIWFSGRPRDQAGTSADVTGTTVPEYINRFNKAYGVADQGVGGAQQDQGSMSFLESALGRRLDPDVKMALLTGALGTMASSSPFFGVAVGQGGLGAVANYVQQKQAEREYGLAQQKMGLETRKTEADVAKTQAEVPKLQAETKKDIASLYEKMWVPGYGYVLIDKSDPLAPVKRLTDEKLNSLTGVKASDVPTRAGSPEPEATAEKKPEEGADASTKLLTKSPQTGATIAVPNDYTPENQFNIAFDKDLKKTEEDIAKKQLEESRNRASAAENQMMRLGIMDKNYETLPKTGFLSPGTGATERLEIGKAANTALAALGGSPIFNTSNVAALEELVKDKFRLGAELSRSIGGREPGFIVEQSVQANPGAESTALGYKRITEGLRAAGLYEQDRNAFLNSYNSKFGHLNGADDLFRQLNPKENYVKMAVIRSVDPKHAQKLRDYVKQYPDARQSAIDTFDKQYGKGTADLIIGGQ